MTPQVRSWDVPVIRALDRVEQLPGFRPGEVLWGSFRFSGTGFGPLDTASIITYARETASLSVPDSVLFRVHRGRFGMYGDGLRSLHVSEAAQRLDAPASSVKCSALLLRGALGASLAEYNRAHAPRRSAASRPLAPIRISRAPDIHQRGGPVL